MDNQPSFHTAIAVCNSSVCSGNGVCVELTLMQGYVCICDMGFEGMDCGINTDDCNRNPCLNGGSCIDGTDDFRCDCPVGFSGNLCEGNVYTNLFLLVLKDN